jgi:hypothetical protein
MIFQYTMKYRYCLSVAGTRYCGRSCATSIASMQDTSESLESNICILSSHSVRSELRAASHITLATNPPVNPTVIACSTARSRTRQRTRAIGIVRDLTASRREPARGGAKEKIGPDATRIRIRSTCATRIWAIENLELVVVHSCELQYRASK